jgi:hypothetical protein
LKSGKKLPNWLPKRISVRNQPPLSPKKIIHVTIHNKREFSRYRQPQDLSGDCHGIRRKDFVDQGGSGGALPICSYNLRYDLDEILISDWSRIGIAPIGSRGFCVWELAQRLFDPSSAGDCSLQTLRQFYQLPEYQAPAALAEVLTVIDLLEQVLLPLAGSRGLDTWADIARFLQNPWYPRKIRMGKFKGVDFMEAVGNPDLRKWLEWLAQSTNERSASMGRWYLEQLASAASQSGDPPILVASAATDEQDSKSTAENRVVVYSHPDLEILKLAIAAVRERLAEAEAQYTRERNAVDVVQARLFGLLRPYYQERDRLKNTVLYRRAFLNAVQRGDDDHAKASARESTKAKEEIDEEYDRASKSAETKRDLTESEKAEMKEVYRKLAALHHPDRFANDPDKSASYQDLTKTINQAKENGDFVTLREISKDPEGFMQRHNLGSLDFSDEAQVGKLRRLLASLEAELLNVLEALKNLLESADYELYRLSLVDAAVVEEAAKQYAEAIKSEIEELKQEAQQLEQEIEELTGESSGVN